MSSNKVRYISFVIIFLFTFVVSTTVVLAESKDHSVLLANSHNKNKNKNDSNTTNTDPTVKNSSGVLPPAAPNTNTGLTEKNTSGIDHTVKNSSGMDATGKSGNVSTEKKKKGRKHSKKKKKEKENQSPGAVHCSLVNSPGVYSVWRPGSTVRVVNRMGSDWQGAIKAAVETWNRVDPQVTFVLEGNDGGASGGFGTIVINPINWASEASYHGVTEPHDTDKDGYLDTININFNNYWYSGRYPWPKHQAREALACHELGHARGLLHAPAGSGGGCMADDRVSLGDPVVSGSQSLADLARAYTVSPVCYPVK